MSTPLSAVIITLNEEKNISRCLKSIQWIEDIIVIDSGSTDQTCEVAESLGASVIHNDWPGFGEQKRVATAAAKHDWVLSLDADEWLSEDASNSIRKLLQQKLEHHAYKIRRRHYFMGKLLRYGISYPDDIIRLYHRKHANWSRRNVHESVETTTKPGFINGDMLHESAPNLGYYFSKANLYTDIQAAELMRQGRHVGLLQIILAPIWQFIRGYIFKLGFMDAIPGLVHNLFAAFNTLMRYAKARELQSKKT